MTLVSTGRIDSPGNPRELVPASILRAPFEGATLRLALEGLSASRGERFAQLVPVDGILPARDDNGRERIAENVHGDED